MAIRTYAQQLEDVQAAIAAIEGGAQSYTLSGSGGARSVTRADLKTLYDRERWLRTMAARASRGGPRIRRVVPE